MESKCKRLTPSTSKLVKSFWSYNTLKTRGQNPKLMAKKLKKTWIRYDLYEFFHPLCFGKQGHLRNTIISRRIKIWTCRFHHWIELQKPLNFHIKFFKIDYGKGEICRFTNMVFLPIFPPQPLFSRKQKLALAHSKKC